MVVFGDTGKKSFVTDIANPNVHLAKIDEIIEFADGKLKDVQLIDVRSHDEFLGNSSGYPKGIRTGHVPGAHNVS